MRTATRRPKTRNRRTDFGPGVAQLHSAKSESAQNSSRILPQIRDPSDDDAVSVDAVKNSERKTGDQQPSVTVLKRRRDFGVRAKQCQRRFEMTEKNHATTFLPLFIPLECRLNVGIRAEKENQFIHAAEPRRRCRTASQVVTASGFLRYSSMRRSNSAICSGETGTFSGCAARSSHNSETRASFSPGDSCRNSGCCSRIMRRS